MAIKEGIITLLWLQWFLLTANHGEALWLKIPASGVRKCVSEKIRSNVVVLADYGVVDEQNPQNIPTVSSEVTSPNREILYHQESVTHGQFAFTTQEAGIYLACFWIDSITSHQHPITLGIDWKIGIPPKDWFSIAKKEKIESVELHLRRVQGLMKAIHEKMNHLKERDDELQKLSEKRNGKIDFWSGYTIMVHVNCVIFPTIAMNRVLLHGRFYWGGDRAI